MSKRKDTLTSFRSLKKPVSKFPANPNSFGKEGEDHINIFWASEFELGRFLSLTDQTYFSTPVLGNFKSLQTVIYFLGAYRRDDRIRRLAGSQLRNYVKNDCGGFSRPRIPNMRAVVMHTAYLRLIQNKEMLKLFVENKLPFDSYRTIESGLRVREDEAFWLATGYNEIQKALQEDREPDFMFLFDTDENTVYGGVVAMLSEGKDNVRIPDMTEFIATHRPGVTTRRFNSSEISDIDGGATPPNITNSVESSPSHPLLPESEGGALVEAQEGALQPLA